MIDLKMEILVKSNSQTNNVFLLDHFVVLNIMLSLIWTIYNRMLAQSMCMTGSDLCSSQKPWESQMATTNVIYGEFYEQVLSIYYAFNKNSE